MSWKCPKLSLENPNVILSFPHLNSQSLLLFHLPTTFPPASPHAPLTQEAVHSGLQTLGYRVRLIFVWIMVLPFAGWVTTSKLLIPCLHFPIYKMGIIGVLGWLPEVSLRLPISAQVMISCVRGFESHVTISVQSLSGILSLCPFPPLKINK